MITRKRAHGGEDLPDVRRKILADGLWPNLGVLPTAESELSGQAVDRSPTSWSRPRLNVA